MKKTIALVHGQKQVETDALVRHLTDEGILADFDETIERVGFNPGSIPSGAAVFTTRDALSLRHASPYNKSLNVVYREMPRLDKEDGEAPEDYKARFKAALAEQEVDAETLASHLGDSRAYIFKPAESREALDRDRKMFRIEKKIPAAKTKQETIDLQNELIELLRGD